MTSYLNDTYLQDADLGESQNNTKFLLSELNSSAENYTIERSARPPKNGRSAALHLPDPAFVRAIIKHRNRRSRYFNSDLFFDPAWDMLLDLAAARAEFKRVSVSSLCHASSVPPTTALRYIQMMEKSGLIVRFEDDLDKRRTWLKLSDDGARAMAMYFRDLEEAGGTVL